MAFAFANAGYEAILMNRTMDSVKPTLDRIQQAGLKGRFVPVDAGSAESIKAAFSGIEANVLVYNVSGSGPMSKSILEIDPAQLEASFHTSVTGALLCSQAVLPSMIQRKEGCILITGATASFRGSAKGGIFASSKMALRGLTQSMAREVAPLGIHVAHIRIDCAIDSEKAKQWMGDKYDSDALGQADDLAQTYLATAHQPKHGWSNEVELRPYRENWTL